MFRSDWDAHLHGICSTYLGTTLNDIGRDLVKEKHLNLIRYLYLNLIVNKEVRRDDLKDWGLFLSNATITPQDFAFLKSLGFMDEVMKGLDPRNLKSLKTLIESQPAGETLDDDKINSVFGNMHTVNTAKNLEVITDEFNLINIDTWMINMIRSISQTGFVMGISFFLSMVATLILGPCKSIITPIGLPTSCSTSRIIL